MLQKSSCASRLLRRHDGLSPSPCDSALGLGRPRPPLGFLSSASRPRTVFLVSRNAHAVFFSGPTNRQNSGASDQGYCCHYLIITFWLILQESAWNSEDDTAVSGSCFGCWILTKAHGFAFAGHEPTTPVPLGLCLPAIQSESGRGSVQMLGCDGPYYLFPLGLRQDLSLENLPVIPSERLLDRSSVPGIFAILQFTRVVYLLFYHLNL